LPGHFGARRGWLLFWICGILALLHQFLFITISGLLKKRADLFNEAERIRDRLAEIKNDIGALDRVLGTLGYTGDLDAQMPRQKREVIFGRGELTSNPQ